MKALLALILAATLSSAAHSAIISFPNNPIIPGEPGPVIAVNFVDTGFRFSPSCHLDFLYTMDCRGDVQNPNPFGPSFGDFGSLYVDFFGKPFSLISLRTAEPFDAGEGVLIYRHRMDLHSSKGGFVSFAEETGATEMFFTGDEWRNITWLVLANNWAASPAHGASNFVVSIPEPAPLTLIGIALVGLVSLRRRAMPSGRQAFSIIHA